MMTLKIDMTGEGCANCKFSAPYDQNQVICRRFPPTVVETGIDRDDKGVAINVWTWPQFPRMQNHGWCGEWEHRKPTEVPN